MSAPAKKAAQAAQAAQAIVAGDLAALVGAVRHLAASVKEDVSLRQLAVLLRVAEQTDTIRGMAAALQLNKPAITRAVDRLSEFDLVVRKRDPDDQRSVLVSIRPAGTKLLEGVAVASLKRVAATAPVAEAA
jgi:DNA-binding MarR family transcriptional regulator